MLPSGSQQVPGYMSLKPLGWFWDRHCLGNIPGLISSAPKQLYDTFTPDCPTNIILNVKKISYHWSTVLNIPKVVFMHIGEEK